MTNDLIITQTVESEYNQRVLLQRFVLKFAIGGIYCNFENLYVLYLTITIYKLQSRSADIMRKITRMVHFFGKWDQEILSKRKNGLFQLFNR